MIGVIEGRTMNELKIVIDKNANKNIESECKTKSKLFSITNCTSY